MPPISWEEHQRINEILESKTETQFTKMKVRVRLQETQEKQDIRESGRPFAHDLAEAVRSPAGGVAIYVVQDPLSALQNGKGHMLANSSGRLGFETIPSPLGSTHPGPELEE
jgi:hypothetical protein